MGQMKILNDTKLILNFGNKIPFLNAQSTIPAKVVQRTFYQLLKIRTWALICSVLGATVEQEHCQYTLDLMKGKHVHLLPD